MAKLTGIIAEKKEKSMSYFRENLLPSETNNVSKGFWNHIKGGFYELASGGSMAAIGLLGASAAGATVLSGIGGLLLGGIALVTGVRATAHHAAGTVQIIKGIVDKVSGKDKGTIGTKTTPNQAIEEHTSMQ